MAGFELSTEACIPTRDPCRTADSESLRLQRV